MNTGFGCKMYKTLRLSVLTRILEDKAAARGTRTSGFITLRSYTGMRQENGTKTKTEIVPFYTFIDNQLGLAKRSLLFDVETNTNCRQLITLCEKYGKIKRIFRAVLGSGKKVALIEMADQKSFQMLASSINDCNGKYIARMPSPFVNADYNSLVITPTDFDVRSIEDVDVTESSVDLNNVEVSNKTLWTLYQDERMNDFSLRLRFLVMEQMNNICSSLWKNAFVFPFGGSVNGFGNRFSDLDLTLIFKDKVKNGFLTFKSKVNQDSPGKLASDKYIKLISIILKDLAPGCDYVTPILSAKVPIVSFYQEYVDLECDLSVDVETGLISTEILYIVGFLHSMVKPLVAIVKKWAKSVKLTGKSPGKHITNYGLLTMVVFFLQQKKVGNLPLLPPLCIFPLNPTWTAFPIKVYELAKANMVKQLSEEQQKNLLDKALYDFFNYYSRFNFKLNGICVKSGSVIPNKGNSLYIQNPLDINLNITKQVKENEFRKIKSYCYIATEIYEKNNCFTNDFLNESYYAAEMLKLTRLNSDEKEQVKKKQSN